MHIACDILAKSHHRKSIHITFFMYKTYGDQRKYCYCFSSVPFFHVPIILPLFCFYFSFLWAQPQINRFFFLTPLLSSSFKLLFFLGLKVYTCLSCLYGPRQPALDSWSESNPTWFERVKSREISSWHHLIQESYPSMRKIEIFLKIPLEEFEFWNLVKSWFQKGKYIPQWGKLSGTVLLLCRYLASQSQISSKSIFFQRRF